MPRRHKNAWLPHWVLHPPFRSGVASIAVSLVGLALVLAFPVVSWWLILPGLLLMLGGAWIKPGREGHHPEW